MTTVGKKKKRINPAIQKPLSTKVKNQGPVEA